MPQLARATLIAQTSKSGRKSNHSQFGGYSLGGEGITAGFLQACWWRAVPEQVGTKEGSDVAALGWGQFLHLISHTSDLTFLASSEFVSVAQECSRFSLPDPAQQSPVPGAASSAEMHASCGDNGVVHPGGSGAVSSRALTPLWLREPPCLIES